MKVLILGGDGYLGWPTAMNFATNGHEVVVVDNYMRRKIALETNSEALITTPNLEIKRDIFYSYSGYKIEVEIGDCADYHFLSGVVQKYAPDCIIHYAEQPSAPYSMKGFESARCTLNNNLNTTFNVIWSVISHVPDCHIIKLGTMGEYGTPNIDIEEGWIDINHNGRSDRFLYPRQAGSLYHTTKVLDTDLLWFYVRAYDLKVTDLMQGPVYGLSTSECDLDDRLMPNFHYDDIFGTVINRFLVQSVVGIPLTVYGAGGQTRGYLNIKDTLQCVSLASGNPAAKGELKVLNQFSEQFTVNEIAEHVRSAANSLDLDVKIEKIPNPRAELEDHYYNAKHTGLLEMGLKPNFLTKDALVEMLHKISKYSGNINLDSLMPRVSWNKS